MPVAHQKHLYKVLDNRLDLRMVEPRHLDDLGQQDDNHFEHLLFTTYTFVNQEHQQVVLDPNLLVICYFGPVSGKKLF